MDLDDGRDRPRPRRSLRIERLEVYDRCGDGHTVSRHCGTRPEVEAERLLRHPLLPATGSFADVSTAQRSVEACIAANHAQVERWRRGGRTRLAIDHDMHEVIGGVLERSRWLTGDPVPVPATGLRVVLRRCRMYPAGFAILTAYPVLHPTAPYPRRP